MSAGSKIVNERFVTHADLGAWAVPEPALLGSVILVVAVCMIRRPRDRSWQARARAASSVPAETVVDPV